MPNYQFSELSDSNYTGQKFLQVFFCYCSYMWAVKVIRGEFNLDFFWIHLFRDFRVLFCGIWSLHSWRTWWSTRQVVRKHHNIQCSETTMVDVETLTEALVKHLWTWEYFCQVLQCQDFSSIIFQTKEILLYILYSKFYRILKMEPCAVTYKSFICWLA
jgi:hypothetical protein